MDYNKSLTLQWKDSCNTVIISWWEFVSDFNKKDNFFINFFASVCIPIKNACTLPYFSYRTNSRINSFHATENDILLIIKSLDPAKAHGCDSLSVKMIKICNKSITIATSKNYF